MGARVGATLALMALGGCHGTPPGSLVGESQHFRLYVDPDLTVPAGFEGDNALAALETEWADVHSMLEMPDGKITYYWVSPAHIRAACEPAEADGCFWPQNLEVDAATLPQPHELNHAYMYLRQQRFPLPFLAEGIAEAIACGDDVLFSNGEVPWETAVVAYPPSQEPYGEGGAFVRYLIRTYGIATFLSYYDQAPEQRDPALFGANFQSFWGTAMDDAWAAMYVQQYGAGRMDSKICPCSLPPVPPGTTVPEAARDPYWVVPTGVTMALTGGATLNDCSGLAQSLNGDALLIELDPSSPWYVTANVNVTTGPYLADDCASTVPYPLPAEEIVAERFGSVGMAVSRSASARTLYFHLGVPFSGLVDVPMDVELCTSCAFDQGSCQPTAAVTVRQPLPGPDVYGRWTIPAGASGMATESVNVWPGLM